MPHCGLCPAPHPTTVQRQAGSSRPLPDPPGWADFIQYKAYGDTQTSVSLARVLARTVSSGDRAGINFFTVVLVERNKPSELEDHKIQQRFIYSS